MYREQLRLRDLEIVTFDVNERKASEMMHQFEHPVHVDLEVTEVDPQGDSLHK